MADSSGPLAVFFSVVMNMLRERLTSEAFAELLKQCEGVEKQTHCRLIAVAVLCPRCKTQSRGAATLEKRYSPTMKNDTIPCFRCWHCGYTTTLNEIHTASKEAQL